MKRKIACRAASRLDITVDREGGNPISEDIQDGCLMRIADALERLSKGTGELIPIESYERRLSALRGVITKLHKKLEAKP